MDAGQLLSTLPNSTPNTAWYFVPLFILTLLFNHVICRRACIRFGHAEKKRLLDIRAGAFAIMAKKGELRSVVCQGKWGSAIRNIEEGGFGIIAIMTNRRFCRPVKLEGCRLLFLSRFFIGSFGM